MEKNNTVKSGIVAMLALLCVIFIAGCTSGKGSKDGNAPTNYAYQVQDIEHFDYFCISKTTYFDDRVEIYVNSKYEFEKMSFSTPDDANARVDTKGDTVILYSDNPMDITSLDVSAPWFEISFRYLNTSEYACIWRTWADDLGWGDYSGDKEKYYTEEEKREQKEAEERAKERREQSEKEDAELFAVFQGKWVSDDGDYFDIFDAGSVNGYSRHGVRYYQNDPRFTEEYHAFIFSKIDQNNKYQMTYTEGDGWGIRIAYDIEYDGGGSFLYLGKEFTRVGEDAGKQQSNRTREYFEDLDKESSLDKIVEDLGPYGIIGSGTLYHVWQLKDGMEARVVFDSKGKIVMIYIADSENNVDRIYKREY